MKSMRLGLLLILLYAGQSNAVLYIEVTGSNASALPIAIVPFGWQNTSEELPVNIAQIVSSDLERSGQFRAIPEKQMLSKPTKGSQIKFENWRILEVENVVVGNIKQRDAETYLVEYQLFDVLKAKQLWSGSYPVPVNELRNHAHQISDKVYQILTGERGAFNTRIAYIVVERKDAEAKYRLEVADTDGHKPRTILRSDKPIMSPSWSPDGRYLTYVSFENNRSEVWVHAVFSGSRERVANFKGINGAPVWSPDGRKLALTSSHNGNPDIYILDLSSKRMQQVTRNWAIDTEPAWMPDGKALVFTSGRGGGPQLYQMELAGGKIKRLTREGSYNASATVSDDGQTVVMVHRDRGKYRIAALDIRTSTLRILTNGRLDESPSFAPNGSMVLYATEQNGKGVLAAVSIDGRTRQVLAIADGEIREPTWGPFPRRTR